MYEKHNEIIKQCLFEEISEIGFEWETTNSDLALGFTYSGGCRFPLSWYSVPDESEGVFYGLDYFIERDYVH